MKWEKVQQGNGIMLRGGLRVNGSVMSAAELSPVPQGLKPRAVSVLYGMSKLMPSRKHN
ncbi:MAG TPA: hypothetical protein VK763_14195 [Terriglobales bacterium]|nr:hypothetical protein [Terriglobales bacterium]